MSHSIDCVIDTTPMAEKIGRMTERVDGTTAAVAGMHAALLQAENDAADRVCADINRGFFSLIHSQISRKLAKLQSEVDSHLFNLNRQMKMLQGLRSRMERDYRMLEARYSKLFTSINRNLTRRVAELDRPVIELAMRDTDRIDNRTAMLGATVPVGQAESVTASQRILAGNMKWRAARAIESMRGYVDREDADRRVAETITLPRREAAAIALPAVVWMTLDSADARRATTRITTPHCVADTPQGRDIEAAVAAASQSLAWETASTHNARIAAEFERFVAANPGSDREKQLIMALFNDSIPDTLRR